jgi:hypothetical protein
MVDFGPQAMGVTMKIIKSGAAVMLPLSAWLLLGSASPTLAQTTAGPPSSTSTVAPPWHNPDLDAPPAASPAPPPVAPTTAVPPAAAAPPPPPFNPPATVASPAPPPPRIGTVAPMRGDARAECREFQQTIMIGGQATKAYGTACRQADGTWKIVH